MFFDFASTDFMAFSTSHDSPIMLKSKNRKNELIFYSLYKAAVMIKTERQASMGETVSFMPAFFLDVQLNEDSFI